VLVWLSAQNIVKSLSTERNVRSSIILIGLLSLLIGAIAATAQPLPFIVVSVVLLVAVPGIFLAYRWPEAFLILAIWTYFLKFTFLFSVMGLGITPFMLFLGLATVGYSLHIVDGSRRLILPVGLWFLLVFIGFTSLSLLLAKDLESSFGLYFRTVLDWILMLLIVQMIVDRQSMKKLVTAILFQAAVIICWGITDALISRAAGQPLVSYDSFFWNQFRKNEFSVYLAFIALLCLVLVIRRFNIRELLLGLALLLPIPIAWLITRSRSGLLALIISLFLFFLLERNGRLLRILLIFSVLVATSFAFFPSQERDLALDGIRALISPEDVVESRNVETISLRYELMEVGWDVLKSHPMLGVGFNQWQFYSPISNSRIDARTGERIDDPLEIHNRHFQIATNSGLVAAMGYIGFVITVIVSAMRSRRNTKGLIRSSFNALIAIAITVQIVLMVTTGFLFEWVIYGMLIGLINLAEIERNGSLAARKWLKLNFLVRKAQV
jgi:hypothetical protein